MIVGANSDLGPDVKFYEQAPKQEKEMADIEEKLAASQVGDLLEAVREKLPASS